LESTVRKRERERKRNRTKKKRNDKPRAYKMKGIILGVPP
jgi:hypothetical protein